jgi:hypothetical protein
MTQAIHPIFNPLGQIPKSNVFRLDYSRISYFNPNVPDIVFWSESNHLFPQEA